MRLTALGGFVAACTLVVPGSPTALPRLAFESLLPLLLEAPASIVKREWHGMRLAASVKEVLGAARVAGFGPELKRGCQQEDEEWVDWYNPGSHVITTVESVRAIKCTLVPTQKPKRRSDQEGLGVSKIELVFLNNKLFRMTLDFGNRETYEGVVTRMPESLGQPVWSGTLLWAEPWRYNPADRKLKYRSQIWEDGYTAIVAYHVKVGILDTPVVTYYDLPMVGGASAFGGSSHRGQAAAR